MSQVNLYTPRVRSLAVAFAAAVVIGVACDSSKTPTAPSFAQATAATPTGTPQPSVTSIEISGPSQLTVGQISQLVATARYSDNSSKDVTSTATWVSSDLGIATVRNGQVNPVFRGSVSIAASLGDVRGSISFVIANQFTPGVVFGPGVSAADQDLVLQARSINERFWGPLDTTVLAYQTVTEAATAYEAYCRCSLSSQRRLELDAEAMASNPSILLVALEKLRTLPDKLGRLTHSEFHAVQLAHTSTHLDPTWLAEGSATYSHEHALGEAGLLNLEAYHQGERQQSSSFREPLRQWEMWPSNPLLPGGCMETNSCQAPYQLGHIATDLLTARLPRSSIISFWRETGGNLRRGMNPDLAWRTAFASAFEISIDDFYVAFEAYRARGFR